MGDDRIRKEALREIGKELNLGQPEVDNQTTADWWLYQQLQPNNSTQDLLFDSIPPLADSVISDISDHHQNNHRKRKGIENQGECQNTQAEYEYSCMGKQEADSQSKQIELIREARNLEERKRRKKITDKFQTLQQLVLQGNNTASQASILDGAITYVKSTTELLQMLANMSPENAKAIAHFYSPKFASTIS